MNVSLLNPFIVAAGELLNAELGLHANRGPLTHNREAHVSDDISVLISIVGDISGIAIISLSFETAKAIVAQMLGEEVSEFNELAQRGIGELGNVITGKATTKLSEAGFEADISVPTMIVGKGSKISTFDVDRLIVPLETEYSTVTLSLALREETSQEKSAVQMAM